VSVPASKPLPGTNVTADVDSIVIGAGVVGLAIGRALAMQGREVLVLEQHGLIGSETSSRNSEVIHAGLYYPTGSLRARLCVAGKHMLYRFCEENGVTHKRCGKLLVATKKEEIPKLEDIGATAKRNGVPDLIPLTQAEARKLEPEAQCEAAYLSPSTGVIDSHGYMVALEGHIASRGGQVVLNTRVDGLSRRPDGLFEVTTTSDGQSGVITAHRVINAAGLGATRVGRMLAFKDGYTVPETYPAKGHYYSFAGKSPFQRLIYPMPQGAWLGLHLTLDVAGKAKFGPDIEWKDEISYHFEHNGGQREATFYREVRRYWPGLPDGGLQPDYTGVRPKIYRESEPVADFAIHGAELHGVANFVGLYGIESPGLTSSLAIGEMVAGMVG
jgi:L-2-hydroxyglutarate oxidase LhgO